MQTINQNFSDRTDILAQRLGCTLRDLGAKIGMSTAMVFAYRSGKNEISRKAWLKLEKAEADAGITLTLVKSDSDGSVLNELRGAIEKAQTAESLISDLKRTLEKLIKKL